MAQKVSVFLSLLSLVMGCSHQNNLENNEPNTPIATKQESNLENVDVLTPADSVTTDAKFLPQQGSDTTKSKANARPTLYKSQLPSLADSINTIIGDDSTKKAASSPTLIPTNLPSDSAQTTGGASVVNDKNHKHLILDRLLRTNVSALGLVNYDNLKQNEKILDEYLQSLELNFPDTRWSSSEAKAFWINAYNAFTIKLILANWPLNSITEIADGKPWDLRWIKLNNETYSLNHIEHNIIRKQFNDPRIHFAINCAAMSCPPLHNRAFTPNNLENALVMLTKSFINNPSFNQIEADEIKVSKIFDWYAEDFGDLATYLSANGERAIEQRLEITFLPYNWGINNVTE